MTYKRRGLTGGKELEPGQKHESWIKQVSWGSHCHSGVQPQSRKESTDESVQHTSFRTRRLQCISSARSRDYCIYHGSSSAACSGSNMDGAGLAVTLHFKAEHP